MLVVILSTFLSALSQTYVMKCAYCRCVNILESIVYLERNFADYLRNKQSINNKHLWLDRRRESK